MTKAEREHRADGVAHVVMGDSFERVVRQRVRELVEIIYRAGREDAFAEQAEQQRGEPRT